MMNSSKYLLAISLLVGVLGWLVWQREIAVAQQKPAKKDEGIIARLKTVEDQLQKQHAYLKKLREGGLLGEFEEKKKNENYKATTDGFVVVFTGGNGGGPEFEVIAGGRPRTRALAGYHGAMCSVKRGQEWLVKTVNDNNPQGSCTVYWMPLQTPPSP